MSIPGLTVSSGAVYQKVDLSEVFGVDFSGNEPLKIVICQTIIDYMRERTSKGKDYNGQAFAPYSESYKESDEYEAYGKSSRVNMKLTGDMLASLDFQLEGNTATFLFDDPEEEAKAFGHMTGMEGHKFLEGKTPAREFFGITRSEIESSILPRFREDIEIMKTGSPDLVSLEEALFGASTTSNEGTVRTLEDLLREFF